MTLGRTVLHEALTVATAAANPEFRVELLEAPQTKPPQPAQRRVAVGRTDEAADQQSVGGPGVLLDLTTGEPLVERAAA
jgi:hypothetical protein